jgi:hypothetical protein
MPDEIIIEDGDPGTETRHLMMRPDRLRPV